MRDDNQQSSSSEAQESERLRHSCESLLVSGGPQTARVCEATRHTTGREEPWGTRQRVSQPEPKGNRASRAREGGHITEPNEAERAK